MKRFNFAVKVGRHRSADSSLNENKVKREKSTCIVKINLETLTLTKFDLIIYADKVLPTASSFLITSNRSCKTAFNDNDNRRDSPFRGGWSQHGWYCYSEVLNKRAVFSPEPNSRKAPLRRAYWSPTPTTNDPTTNVCMVFRYLDLINI